MFCKYSILFLGEESNLGKGYIYLYICVHSGKLDLKKKKKKRPKKVIPFIFPMTDLGSVVHFLWCSGPRTLDAWAGVSRADELRWCGLGWAGLGGAWRGPGGRGAGMLNARCHRTCVSGWAPQSGALKS